jgi:hypothetical protein
MSDLRSASPQQLYVQWRRGDPEAGQAMAQRFSDWYYAVTSSRLGDSNGRVPLQRSCTRFQQGIGAVKEADLVTWSHSILAEELQTAGGRIAGGDFPNVLTGTRSPEELLRKAQAALPRQELQLLAHAYDSSYPYDQVTREAEALGGMPLAVLRARYELKRWLRDNEKIAFTEIPTEPNLDYQPLPLYEAGRMSTNAEETGFEKWLLSNMPLCKDIAEFGVFALALRAGAVRDLPAAGPQKAAAPRLPEAAPVRPDVAPKSGSTKSTGASAAAPILLIALAGLGGLVVVGVIVAFVLLG